MVANTIKGNMQRAAQIGKCSIRDPLQTSLKVSNLAWQRMTSRIKDSREAQTELEGLTNEFQMLKARAKQCRPLIIAMVT